MQNPLDDTRRESQWCTMLVAEGAWRLAAVAVWWFNRAWLARLVQRAIRSATPGLSADVVGLLESVANVAVQGVVALVLLGSLGVDVTSLVAGFGLLGFALAYALEDVISNVLCGSKERPNAKRKEK